MTETLRTIARFLHAATCNDSLPMNRAAFARGIIGHPVSGWMIPTTTHNRERK